MRRLLSSLLVVGLLATAGAARGGEGSFAVSQGVSALPSALAPNGSDLVLAPSWLAPPAQPLELSSAQLLDIWKSAGQTYNVPWTVLAAINKIESNFGRNMGPSSAGAIGWMQFMPSTWLRWGTDADGNGIVDPWNPVDAIYSAARYLSASGASADIGQAVFAYNHAWWYVTQVLQLAQLYGGSDGVPADQAPGQQTVFALDRLQAQLDDARTAVTIANKAYRAALGKARMLADDEQMLVSKVEAQPLLSDRLEAQKHATQAGVDTYAAQTEADRLKSELDAAQATLAGLQGNAQGAAFNRPAGQVLSAAPAQGAGTYVFPVGGGPSVVSVSHWHHDYPAADIAAPEGSPVYALSDGTVLYSWSSDERCGTGFTIETTDGQIWTYCHLSYLYPEVVKGVQLQAGAPVGLVGHTGHSTGPHLHLQLQPADSYPQDQQWFESFAGTAFQWSDEPTTRPGAETGPLVFHIVEPPAD